MDLNPEVRDHEACVSYLFPLNEEQSHIFFFHSQG